MTDLKAFGWNSFFESQLTDEERRSSLVARIVEPLRGLSRAVCVAGEIWAEHTEKSASGAKTREAVPATGDWVVGGIRDFGGGEKRMTIHRVLTRKNKLSRAAPGGKGYEQILCTNADIAFLVLALTQETNLPSIGRYLEILNESGIAPVIVLTKVDAGTDSTKLIQSLSEVAPGIPLHSLSVKERRGVDVLKTYFSDNKTIVLLGASGAGKSTLVNYLLGTETSSVQDVRESDQKGRHTTTGRRLYSLPYGGMVIDSPGIREIQKWEGPSAEAEVEVKKKTKGHKHSRARRSSEEEDD